MSEKYKFNDPFGMYFVTMTVVDWIDLFTRYELKDVIVDSLKYCQKEKGLIIHAWCIMPSHLHLIISSEGQPLPELMRDFKKFTSKKLITEIKNINESRRNWLLERFEKAGEKLKRIKHYKVWQDGNHPELLFSNKFIDQKVGYLHNNPVEAGIVDEAEAYLHSSARDYFGTKKGLLEIEMIA
ncbi:MAG: transposase [Cyclobacteriaceae bacterium]